MHGDDEKSGLPCISTINTGLPNHITSTAGLHKMLGQDIIILVTDFVYHEAECYTSRPIRSILAFIAPQNLVDTEHTVTFGVLA